MNRIKALPRNVAERIASGEVIERPLSVVKELLENSIDAEANTITVEIKKGGKEYIRVTDNGCGIARDDVVLAFTRFATSKIYDYEDLSNISTLGFRGVALSSIASVSRTEMLTKTSNSKTGTRIFLEGGEQLQESAAACEEGTTIVVRDLFFNTPERLKFLKSDNQEAAFITDYVSKMAVAYPERKIRLISNGSVLFSTNGKNDLNQAILTVYSRSLTQDLIHVDGYSQDGIRISGYVSSPSQARKSRKYQIFYVNKRWVKCKALEAALDEAYSDRLFDGLYPNAFLFLDINPQKVDVNLLPNKTELRFYDEDEIISFATHSIRRAITSPESIPKADLRYSPVFIEDSDKSFNTHETNNVYSNFNTETIFRQDFFQNLREEKEYIQEKIDYSGETEEYKEEPASKNNDFPVSHLNLSDLEIVGQIFASYIICKSENTVYLFDQHAAHERIMFEQLLSQFKSQEKVVQPMLIPIVIQLTNSEKQAAEEKIDMLSELGFEISEFGPNEFAVKTVPAALSENEAQDFISNVLDKDTLGHRDRQIKYDEIISNACKAAVKANNRLDTSEIRALLNSLEKCENPYSCPHGRPTFLKLSVSDIEKMFKRK